MIDLTKLPADEAERLAYAEGFTGTAALFARIAELESLLQIALEYFDARSSTPDWVDEAREVLK